MSRRLVLSLPDDRDLPVVWAGPVFEYTGYADEVRAFVSGLHARRPVRTFPVGEGDPSFVDHLDPVTRALVRASLDVGHAPEHSVCVYHMPAHGFRDEFPGAVRVVRTMFETDGLPADWVHRLNQADEVWVPSQFNVETFRAAGVRTPLHVVHGGIDSMLYRPGLEPLPIDGLRGTVFLSVFEWSFRKGWDVLLKAWASAFTAADDVTLLIRTHPIKAPNAPRDTHDIERRINTFLKKLGTSRKRVAPIVLVHERVPPADMPRLYATADAYVGSSRGEGWGRPFLEAMASGLPVIAPRWSGNTEFMTDDNSLLVDVEGLDAIDDREEFDFYQGQRWARPSVSHLAERLQTVAGNREEALAIGGRARRDVERRWTWGHVIDQVEARLTEIRDGLWRAPAGGAGPAVRWVGDQYSHKSLALANREVCSRLLDRGTVELELVSYEADADRDLRGDGVRALEQRTGPMLPGPAAVEVRHQWPPSWTPPKAGAWVVCQPWEFGGLPDIWMEPLSTAVDEIWCYTNYVRDCYLTSGIPPTLLKVIPLGVDHDRFTPEGPTYPLRTTKATKFLFVGGTIMRKGIDVLLEAYAEAFGPDDDVCLVVKSTGSADVYRNDSHDALVRALAEDPGAPEVELVEAHLEPDELAALYRSCDALVHPYRGEGFGLTVAEAMASGLPVIVTAAGACTDFCDDDNAYLVPARRRPVNAVGGKHSSAGFWLAEPDRPTLVEHLRAVVADPRTARSKGAAGRRRAVDELTWDRTAEAIEERLVALAGSQPRRFRAPEVDAMHLDVGDHTPHLVEVDWPADEAEAVIATYVTTLGPGDGTTLVLPLPATSGLSLQEAGERVVRCLGDLSVDPAACADILVVPHDGGSGALRDQVDSVLTPAEASDPATWRSLAGLEPAPTT